MGNEVSVEVTWWQLSSLAHDALMPHAIASEQQLEIWSQYNYSNIEKHILNTCTLIAH